MLRIGIAGIGFMGMIHYVTYQKLRGARVVALCEQNQKRLAGDWRDIRGNFGPPGEQMNLAGIHTYTELDELLADPEVDLVDITLPPSLHADVAQRAFVRRKHVFSEKPMALTAADCDRMLRAARAAKRSLLVGHVLPFFPEYAWALKIVRGGRYGKLCGGSFRRVISDPQWLKNFWSAEQIGGPMLDLHVHDAHFIRLLFGMPKSVVTRGTTHNDLPKFWHSLFDYGEGGCVVEATSGAIDQQGREFDHGFEIRLEKATILFQFAVIGGVGSYLCPPTILEPSGKVKRVELSGDPLDAFRAELGEVVHCVGKQRHSEVLNGELARDAITLCRCQMKSLATGRAVRV